MIEKAEQTRNTKKSNNTNHDKRATQKSLKKKRKFCGESCFRCISIATLYHEVYHAPHCQQH